MFTKTIKLGVRSSNNWSNLAQIVPVRRGNKSNGFNYFHRHVEMTETGTITNSTLKELASSGAVTSIRLVAQTDGFALFIRYGLSEKILQAKRGHIRRFRSLERAVMFVRRFGISRVEVDVTNWEPRQRSL